MRAKNNRRISDGFTLAELLVVISVLGMLAGVVVFAVGGINDRGQASACAEDARTLKTAEETYRATKGTYATEDALVAAGLLTKASDLHDIALITNAYSVEDTGSCASSAAAPVTTQGISIASGGQPGLTVALATGADQPLAGGDAQYSDGSWIPIGITGTDGQANTKVPDGSYTFRVDFRGETMTSKPMKVTSGSIITFHTVTTTVRFSNPVDGEDLADSPIAMRGNDGYWMTIDATDKSGVAVAELLPGDYEARVDFHGSTKVYPSVAVANPTTIDVPLTQTRIHTGQGVAATHRGNNGQWAPDSAADSTGFTTTSLLAGTYDFDVPALHNGVKKGGAGLPQLGVDISGTTFDVKLP